MGDKADWQIDQFTIPDDDSQPDYGLEETGEMEDDILPAKTTNFGIPYEIEEDYTHSTTPCDYCEGSGTVQDGYYGIGSNLYPCGVCKGTGVR